MNEKEKSMTQTITYSETTYGKLFKQHYQLQKISLGLIFLAVLLAGCSLFFITSFINGSKIIRLIGILSLIGPLIGGIIPLLTSFLLLNKINYDLNLELLDNNDVVLFYSKRLKILNEDIIKIHKKINKAKSSIRTSIICIVSYFGIASAWIILVLGFAS